MSFILSVTQTWKSGRQDPERLWWIVFLLKIRIWTDRGWHRRSWQNPEHCYHLCDELQICLVSHTNIFSLSSWGPFSSPLSLSSFSILCFQHSYLSHSQILAVANLWPAVSGTQVTSHSLHPKRSPWPWRLQEAPSPGMHSHHGPWHRPICRGIFAVS